MQMVAILDIDCVERKKTGYIGKIQIGKIFYCIGIENSNNVSIEG